MDLKKKTHILTVFLTFIGVFFVECIDFIQNLKKKYTKPHQSNTELSSPTEY